MLALRTASVVRAARPLVRSYHVENKVNNNLPFKYEGESKTRFTAAFTTVLSVAFAAPFLVSSFAVKKASS
ncbi:hypothetical protein JCM8097_004836 [Rhodosporidiobolus ruineniae]